MKEISFDDREAIEERLEELASRGNMSKEERPNMIMNGRSITTISIRLILRRRKEMLKDWRKGVRKDWRKDALPKKMK